eukprot:tig00000113_g5654.t1
MAPTPADHGVEVPGAPPLLGPGAHFSKPVIAVDLDEVLGQFVVPLVEFHNATYNTQLKLQDFHSYTFCEVWGGTNDEATEKVHAFFESKYFQDIPLVPGAHDVLEEFRDRYDFVVITSRQSAIEQITKEWLARHYAGIFKGILFGNHYGLTGAKRSKPDMCGDVGARLLIDDSLVYAKQCAAHGIEVLLFDWEGRYMWGKCAPGESEPPGVRRVANWREVRERLASGFH